MLRRRTYWAVGVVLIVATSLVIVAIISWIGCERGLQRFLDCNGVHGGRPELAILHPRQNAQPWRR